MSDWKTPMCYEDQPNLRDQFAIAAMQGLMACKYELSTKELAEWSYKMAYAMMRTKQT